MKYYVFDLETFPNCFLWSGKFENDDKFQVFEMSSRKNQRSELLSWLSYLQNSEAQLVGYNNLGFDYPITHELLNNPYTFTCDKAYQVCQTIINQPFGAPLQQVPLRDRILPQIDLMKINHFDNANKRTSLKSLQFAMRSASVEDLPIPPGTVLTPEQMDLLIEYNKHDISETELFLKKCKHLIELRKDLLDQGVLSGDVLNFSDVKIGTEYLIKKLGRTKCFLHGSTPRQTKRQSIEFKDIILPSVQFKSEPFQAVVDWFKNQIFYTEGENRPHLEAKLANLNFFFGVGGAHASVDTKKYVSNETHVIKDVDVSSMYPSIAVANNFAPEHLGKEFSDAYAQIVIDRKHYKKGTSMNATLKLAGNGAFGNGDNKYSCFYDPRFPKQITINGQLQILQLAEILSFLPGLEIIQANTDGITVWMPRKHENFFQLWKSDWESQTGLKLEEVEYSKMFIRDVNNYTAVTVDGKIKNKGAYFWPKEPSDYDGIWNKDFSMMVVQKVVEQMHINDWNPEALIRLVSEPFDFMMRYKTPAGAKVFIGDKEMLKTVRYYVSTKGERMVKKAIPKGEIGQFKRKNSLSDSFFNEIYKAIGPNVWDPRIHTANKSRYEIVVTTIESGRLVKECNIASKFDFSDVDYDFYLKEIYKLEIK